MKEPYNLTGLNKNQGGMKNEDGTFL